MGGLERDCEWINERGVGELQEKSGRRVREDVIG
jgi:hypothetical protein